MNGTSGKPRCANTTKRISTNMGYSKRSLRNQNLEKSLGSQRAPSARDPRCVQIRRHSRNFAIQRYAHSAREHDASKKTPRSRAMLPRYSKLRENVESETYDPRPEWATLKRSQFAPLIISGRGGRRGCRTYLST